ncbi:MAG: NAD(P)-dependent glycerol-3-phosphate dehydrogenase [Proteobacteria bacterium]|nr:NAD(P)-dependent glycerol-3-phosphate dehydrogenase [Pseudomonadota bacterium]
MKVSIIGAGSFGTAISQLFSKSFGEVHLWVYEEEVYRMIIQERENKVFMPGFKLSDNIIPSLDMESVLKDSKYIFVAVPSHVFRNVLNVMKPHIPKDSTIISVAKGIENKTNYLMIEVIEDVLGRHSLDKVCVLSGPSFAKEVIEGKPTLVVVAGKDSERAETIQKIFSTNSFRIYTSDDVTGVELGGALKNVIAISAGICEGMKLGYNGMAALITRGLAEMTRLGVAMGANPLTFKGLSGIGDLVLTCTGSLSRNRQVGIKLAEGFKIEEIERDMKMVAEGVRTSLSVYELSKKYEVDMPISKEVYKIIYHKKDPKTALKELMERKLKFEREYIF